MSNSADDPRGRGTNGRDHSDSASIADDTRGRGTNGRDHSDSASTAERADRRTRPPHFLVSLDLDDVPCLVVGGGVVAARKAQSLLEAGAVVTVVSPTAVPELHADPRVRWHQREYRRGEVASYRLAITATGITSVDAQVSRDARAAGVPVNSADDPANCSFTLPAVARRGDVQVAVATAGRSPALASWLRGRIEQSLDDSLLDLLDLLAATRTELRDAGVGTELPGWRRALDGDLPALVAQGRLTEARELLLRELDVRPGEAPTLVPLAAEGSTR